LYNFKIYSVNKTFNVINIYCFFNILIIIFNLLISSYYSYNNVQENRRHIIKDGEKFGLTVFVFVPKDFYFSQKNNNNKSLNQFVYYLIILTFKLMKKIKVSKLAPFRKTLTPFKSWLWSRSWELATTLQNPTI